MKKKNLLEQKIQLINDKYCFGSNCYIQKISKPKNNNNYLLNYKKLTYLINLKDSNSKNWKKM